MNMRSLVKKLSFFLTIAFCFIARSQAQIITTIAGTSTAGFTGDSVPAVLSEINYPKGIVVSPGNNIYFSDQVSSRIRYIDPQGIIHTIAGTGVQGYSGDNGPATIAKINAVKGLCIDATGNLFIADQSNNRVRKIDPGGTITTIAGTGTYGYSGDGGMATDAQIAFPFGVVTDAAGNLYFSDQANYRIRKVSPGGIITTIAGTGSFGYSGDGGNATDARLRPNGIALDGAGNLYFADLSSRVRVVTPAGIISTIAGNGTPGYSGDGGPATDAQLNDPYGLAVDNAGNLYISCPYSNCVRKVNSAGIISTFAGTGTPGFSGDGGPATAADLDSAGFITIDCAGNFFISDNINQRIRKITYNHAPSFTLGHDRSFSVCNTSSFSLDSLLGVTDSDTGQTETWTVSSAALHGLATGGYTGMSTGAAVSPSGFSYTPHSGYTGSDTFSVAVTDCSIADTIIFYVSVVSVPTAGTITGADSVCAGHAVSLTDTAGGGVWGASNTHASVSGGVATGVTPGADTITYIVSNACGSSAASHVLGIKACPAHVLSPNVVTNNMIAFPNPASGEFNILITSRTNELVSITVENMLGEKVYATVTATNSTLNIPLAVPPGFYVVRALTKGGVPMRTMVIER